MSESSRTWQKLIRNHPLFLILLGSLLALQPLFQSRIAWRADGLLHFYRLAQLDRALRHGTLYPRWLPDLGLGFGFPLFNYYAPLGYFVVEPLCLIGLDISTALMLSYALALLVIGLGTYLWTKDVFGHTAGLIAALAAVYAPYTLYNVYHRGALAEVWGLAWLPLILWSLRRLVLQSRNLVLTTLTYAALILSHNILALICSPLIVGYAFFLWLLHPSPTQTRWRQASLPIGALMLAIGLSAFFWAPALLEKDLVQIHQLYAPNVFDYRNNFANPGELLATPIPADPHSINPGTPRGLGWPQALLACIALYAFRRTTKREARAHIALLSLTTLGLTLMLLPLSTPVWERLPLLRFVQFPWRFLGPAGLTFAPLAGVGASYLAGCRFRRTPLNRFGSTGWLALAVLAILSFALTWLFPAPYPAPPNPSPIDVIRFEIDKGALGTTSAGDYLPIGVEQTPPPDALLPAYQAAAPDYIVPRFDPSSLPQDGQVVQADYGLTSANLTFDVPAKAASTEQTWTARFNWYFFPGWQAKLDGKPHKLYASSPHGLIAADLPAGQHRLSIHFGDTSLRRLVNLASLVSLTILLLLSSRPKIRQPNAQQPSTRQPANLFALMLVPLGLFILKTAYLDQHNNPLRHSRFDGQRISGVQNPLYVQFGDLVLLGYDLESAKVRSDGVFELALYWRTLKPQTNDYSIALHLVDERGWRYGQQDSQHPADYPTSRWQTSEYARDVHRLVVWPGAPPGEYTLLVGVYDVTSGRQLDRLDANGAPAGVSYSLAQAQVSRPTQPTQADELSIDQPFSPPISWTQELALLGLDPPADHVNAGEHLALTLYWQALSAPQADYLAHLRLVSSNGQIVSQKHTPPGRADHATSVWQPKDIIRDNHSLLVPAETPNGEYVLQLNLSDANYQTLEPTAALAIVAVSAPTHNFALPKPQHTLNSAHFGDLADLLGYDLDISDAALSPGQTWQLTLYWQARRTADVSYSAFAHLLDADNHIYAQRDQIPAAGKRPTTGWLADEIIQDHYTLTLATDAPPGEYQLEVGLYDPRSGDRLPLLDAANQRIDDRSLLPTRITVE